MVEVKERLHEEFTNEMLNLRGMEMGTKEYANCVDGITKIVDRLIAIDEKERANALNKKKAEAESEANKKKMRDEFIDRWVGHGLTALKIGASIGVPVWITIVSMGFEHSETMTYNAGREAIRTCLSFMKKG